MTDTQLLTIVLAILASLGAVFYNNSRLNDLGKRIDDVNRHIDDKFNLLSLQLKHVEDTILRLVGDQETRLQKLEKNK